MGPLHTFQSRFCLSMVGKDHPAFKETGLHAMTDMRRAVGASLSALIDGFFGCYDAAAETINARWGRGASKGTISKKISGLLDWTVADVIALEDASGRYPVTRMMARRLDQSDSDSGCIILHAGSIAKEAGEAVGALLAASQSADAGDHAQAIKELDDVETAIRLARSRLEA